MRYFIHSQNGTITIMTAALLPFIIGLLALSVDYGMWLCQKRKLQAVADVAIIGALKAIKDGTPSQALTYASNDASLNGFTAGNFNKISVNSPPTTGQYKGNGNAVEISLSQLSNSYFSSFLLPTSPTLTVQAVGLLSSSKVCLITLGSSKGISFSCDGSIKMPNCGIYVDANTSDSISTDKNRGISATSVSTVGDIKGSNITAPQGIFKGAAKLADPLAGLAMPTPGSCTANQYQGKGTQTINPGTYCNGFQVNSNANITMNPGVYIITQEDMQIEGNATLNGKGVTIVLTGSGGKYTKLSIKNSAAVNLSAPTTGTYKGVLIFGDRNATNLTHKFEAGISQTLDGMIYTPASDIKFGDNSTTAGTFGTQIIARSFEAAGVCNLGGDGTAGPVTSAGQLMLTQ